MVRHIFIDTCVFERFHFKWSTKLLVDLIEHVKSGRAVLHSTTMTDAEVRRRVVEYRARLVQAVSELPEDMKSQLAASESPGAAALEVGYDGFLASSAAKIHKATSTDFEEIVQRYRLRIPPFGNLKTEAKDDGTSGKGGSKRKKHEFQDAFAFLVLKGVFGDGPEELHIVSHDGDWEGMCHGVSWANFHKNLMGVIGLLENDRIQNQQAEKEFAAVAMEAAPTFNKKGLEEADEHVAGGWYFLPDEPDTEVANVEVIGHEILLTELLDSDRAHGLATIGHTVRFELEAETISAEEGVGIWNSEDKHMYAWPKQHGRIRYFVEAPVGFDISVENGVWGLDNVWTEAPDSGGINDYEWLQLPKTKFLEEDDPDNFDDEPPDESDS